MTSKRNRRDAELGLAIMNALWGPEQRATND